MLNADRQLKKRFAMCYVFQNSLINPYHILSSLLCGSLCALTVGDLMWYWILCKNYFSVVQKVYFGAFPEWRTHILEVFPAWIYISIGLCFLPEAFWSFKLRFIQLFSSWIYYCLNLALKKNPQNKICPSVTLHWGGFNILNEILKRSLKRWAGQDLLLFLDLLLCSGFLDPLKW